MNPSPPDCVTAQHVWLDDHIPGLLVRWRRDTSGWLGMVCYLSRSTDEPVAEWFPADRITPLPQDKP